MPKARKTLSPRVSRCTPTLVLSLPRRILEHFTLEAQERGVPFDQVPEVFRDYITQYCIALLQNPDEFLPALERVPRGAAKSYSLYIANRPSLMKALNALAERHHTTPVSIARAAFYAYDMKDSRFQIKPPKQPELRAARHNPIIVLVDERVRLDALATFNCPPSASDAYRTLVREFIESGDPLPPPAVLNRAKGLVQIGFMLSDAENASLRGRAEQLNTTITNVVRAALLKAIQS